MILLTRRVLCPIHRLSGHRPNNGTILPPGTYPCLAFPGERYLSLGRNLQRRKNDAASRQVDIAFMRKVKGASNWKVALSVLAEMEKKGIRPNVYHYSAAMANCRRQGKWREAINLLRKMENSGIEPNVVCYSAAISACEKGRQVERAQKLFREMIGRGFQPDVILFGAMISACEKCGKWEMAVGLLKSMLQYGFQPDATIYNATISACGKGGQWEKALELLQEMIKKDILLADEEKKRQMVKGSVHEKISEGCFPSNLDINELVNDALIYM